MLPLAHCTRMDAALEQVSLLLQREYCCVFLLENTTQRLECICCLMTRSTCLELEVQARHYFIHLALTQKCFSEKMKGKVCFAL